MTMEQPRIVSRTRRTEAVESKGFVFTKEMIPDSGSADFLRVYREKAWEQFERLPLPNTQMEAWRRTEIKLLNAGSLALPQSRPGLAFNSIPSNLLEPIADEAHGGEILLSPEGAQIRLSPELSEQGVVFADFKTAVQKYPQQLEKILGKLVKAEESKFAALAAALAETGILLYIPRGVQLSQPLHSLIWGPGPEIAYLSHLMVYLEEGASATFVHEYASPNQAGGQTFHSGIVEIYVGEEANLRFVELQSWGANVWNFTHERVKVDRGGTLDWIFGAIGSRLTKNFSDLDLAGQGATGRMSGFYFTDGFQHLDHDTQQNHMAPNTTSDLLFKGALQGESRSVWQGMIYVAPGALKTDGYQANRNLVLSPKARADSIPGLEILADDVRCTHGATVGKIDQDQVFYLRSRGIPEKLAERLIVEGFFDPIMQRIPFEGVRQRFQQAISQKMGGAD
ncbi:MAG TPA: Fe-S cluster assembly protein SufD [Anaerolineaceae bacterium]|nr:Fe-S cluster assembly protein SufD [Anaerolineaceae bacterium]